MSAAGGGSGLRALAAATGEIDPRQPGGCCGSNVQSRPVLPHVTVRRGNHRPRERSSMAKIWAVYEGNEPTIGGPWAHLPVSEAVALFELRPDDYVSGLKPTPRFGDVNRDFIYAGFKHIVVEIKRNEGRQANWKPGFYKSRIKPKEAVVRLIRQALVTELGGNIVERLKIEPTTDSQGRGALKITVVIAPGATDRIAGGAVLDALVSVQDRFREMREERIPIIEYATEAELD